MTCWPALRLSSTSCADRPLADPRHEVLDDAEVDVRLEQGEAHLAHRGIDVGLGDAAAAGQAAEDATQSFGKIVKHGNRVYRRSPRMPSGVPPPRGPRLRLPFRPMAAEPLLDPTVSAARRTARPVAVAQRRVPARLGAATISIFGSLVTRVALPFVAIVTLNADAIGVALVRSMDLIAGLAVGLVAGAWVDRLRRRPVMIWRRPRTRAACSRLIPLAAVGGWLSLPLLLLVALA